MAEPRRMAKLAPSRLGIAPAAAGGAALVLVGSFLPWYDYGVSDSAWDVPAALLVTGGNQASDLRVGLLLAAAVAVVVLPLLTRPMPDPRLLLGGGLASAGAGMMAVLRLMVEDGGTPDLGMGLFVTIFGGGLISYESWRLHNRSATIALAVSDAPISTAGPFKTLPAEPDRSEALSEARHWWMVGFSIVTFGLGMFAVLNGETGDIVFGLVTMTAVIGAGWISNLWTTVKGVPLGYKLLVWLVAIVGGGVASFFVVILWITLKLLNFAFGLLGVDLGLRRGLGVGTILRRSSRGLAGRRPHNEGRSDWERILAARSIGGERITREGGFTYIGGQRVLSDGKFIYLGDERVIEEGGLLRVGDKVVSRSGGHLYVDGKLVEE